MRTQQLLFAVILPAILIAALVSSPAGSVQAVGALDQAQTVQDTLQFAGGVQLAAQTFIAGQSGLLDQVDLPLGTTAPGALGTITVEIRAVVGGLPGGGPALGQGTVLAGSVAVQPGSPFPFLAVPLTTPAPVVAGTPYAIVIGTTGAGINLLWGGTTSAVSGSDAYTSGESFFASGGVFALSGGGVANVDQAFRTYVTVPTPTVTPTGVSTATPTVPDASPSRASGDDTPRKSTAEQRQNRQRTDRSNRDDERTEGNVLGTACESVPPQITLANRDGAVTVILMGPAADACGSVKVGGYVEVVGAKEHETLFHADDLSTSR